MVCDRVREDLFCDVKRRPWWTHLTDSHRDDATHSRREVLSLVGRAAVPAGFWALGGGKRLTRLLSGFFSRDEPPTTERTSYLDLILPGANSQIIPADNLVALQRAVRNRRPYGSALVAANAAFKYLTDPEGDSVEIAEQPDDIQWNDANLIIFGSPASNQIAQKLLGGGELTRHREEISERMPFLYIEHPGDVVGTVRRYSETTHRIIEENNWSIFDRKNQRPVPGLRTDRDGFILEDYLLITRWKSDFADGRYITIIGGSHGIGTRSFSLLTLESDLLDRAVKSIDGPDTEFQSLFRVVGVKHDQTIRATTFDGIEHVTTLPFLPGRRA